MAGVALLSALLLVTGAVGWTRLRRALARTEVLPEEVALACAWIFLGGSLVWLDAYLGGSTLLGFDAPWTWLAASHFAAAGFGALTVTALTCRAVSHPRALRVLRVLLVAHPLAYFVVAAGITGVARCEKLGAATYEGIFLTQWVAVVLGRPDRMGPGPRRLLVLALFVPVITLVPALAWAWRAPLFDLWGMVRYHGLVNALGHVGLGFAAFAWGRPEAHAPPTAGVSRSARLAP